MYFYWWWCGSYGPDAGFKLGPNTKTMKYFIDFAAAMGWRYQLVDWQWYGAPFRADGSFNLDADITKMNPEINIPELVEYAANKNVKIILWLLWCDAADLDLNPRKLIKKEFFVNRNTDINIDVVSNGGFVAIFTPQK